MRPKGLIPRRRLWCDGSRRTGERSAAPPTRAPRAAHERSGGSARAALRVVTTSLCDPPGDHLDRRRAIVGEITDHGPIVVAQRWATAICRNRGHNSGARGAERSQRHQLALSFLDRRRAIVTGPTEGGYLIVALPFSVQVDGECLGVASPSRIGSAVVSVLTPTLQHHSGDSNFMYGEVPSIPGLISDVNWAEQLNDHSPWVSPDQWSGVGKLFGHGDVASLRHIVVHTPASANPDIRAAALSVLESDAV